jgi:nitrate/TMAO reductase-like tetraheme cytochrome c subunit
MAANPAHAAGGFPTLCTQCHSMNGWKPATFDHQATKFVLTGKHLIVTCQDCHTNGNYLLVYSSCFQCHQSNYQNSTNPNHAAGGFSIQCETCHSTTAWVPATFNHATTKFPLTGTHVTTACQKCHVNGNYQLTYSSCYQCHQSNYQNSTNPNHIASGFSIQCDLCHSTTAWSPASFNHATTKFPLTGAHLTTACQKCHVNGNYQLAYSSCYQCHQSNYQNSTNPNHTVSGFSTQCDLCHSTTAWSPASFNHATTKFPLTGAHVSVACQTCHTQGNYKLVYTDCYQCHVSDFQRPTSPNHVAELFPHACDMCHTASVWKPVKYNHDSQYFKIYSGAHNRRWTLCRDCHPAPSDYSSYTCTTSCHTQAKMDSEHSGRSGYSYSSPACYSCHRSV